jgi:hypothetical protein
MYHSKSLFIANENEENIKNEVLKFPESIITRSFSSNNYTSFDIPYRILSSK